MASRNNFSPSAVIARARAQALEQKSQAAAAEGKITQYPFGEEAHQRILTYIAKQVRR